MVHAIWQLWTKDQLSVALRQGQAFKGFQEGPLLFPPTFKYDVGTENYDTSIKVSTSRSHHLMLHALFLIASIQKCSGVRKELIESSVCLKTLKLWICVQERVPSWTDRILYKTRRVKAELQSYDVISSVKSSDHRPVKAHLTFKNVL